MSSTCLSGPALNAFKKANALYEDAGAPVFEMNLPLMSEIEMHAKIISDSVEEGGPSAYPGDPGREVASNPAPTAHDLLKIVNETKAAREDLEQENIERGLSPKDARRLAEEAFPFPLFTQENLDIEYRSVLSATSAKLAKSTGYGWYTPGLYLAASTLSHVADLCTHASDGCRSACLVASGQADMRQRGADGIAEDIVSGRHIGGPNESRFRKTILYVFNRTDFRRMLVESIGKHEKIAKRERLEFGVRLNTTSDLGWESEGIMQQFPNAIFYDYTKIHHRMENFLESEAFDFFGGAACQESGCIIEGNRASRWPKNYYLCFSASETNLAWCLIFLRRGGNVVMPFDDSLGKDVLPSHFLGRKVIDADYYDMRQTDYIWPRKSDLDGIATDEPPPYICGLAVKGGKQRKEQREIADSGGFFFSAAQAQDHAGDPEFIVSILSRSTSECFRQYVARQKNPLMYLPTKAQFKKYVPDLADVYSEILDENLRKFSK